MNALARPEVGKYLNRAFVSTTHFASRSMVGALTGPAMQCSTRPSGAQK